MTILRKIILLLLILPGLTACTTLTPTAISSTQAPVDITTADLGNVAYTIDNKIYPLQGGAYHNPANADNLCATDTTQGDTAYGTLDGVPSAAVILDTIFCGTSNFSALAVVQMQDDTPVNIAAVMIGEWIMLNSVTIADNQITLDMITHAPSEVKCCATTHVIKSYALEDGRLVVTNREEISGSTG